MLETGAPGLAGAARHNAAMVCSACAAPKVSHSNWRSWSARSGVVISPAVFGIASFSDTSCMARLASKLESRLPGFPKTGAHQNELGKHGIDDGAGRAIGMFCGQPRWYLTV